MFIPVITSSTVISPSPLQSPSHRGGGASPGGDLENVVTVLPGNVNGVGAVDGNGPGLSQTAYPIGGGVDDLSNGADRAGLTGVDLCT